MRHNVWSVGAMALVTMLFVPRFADGAELLSYAARYELRLVHASSSEGPRAAVGTLDSVFQETCDGWDTRSRTVLDLAFRDSSNFTNERYFNSWESKNGREYKFTVHTFRNGRTVEAFDGRAEIEDVGGRAYYAAVGEDGVRASEEVALDLPEGTMLPVVHATALLDHAKEGTTLFRSVVLDGASSTGPRVVSVAIGKRDEGGGIPETLNGARAEDIDKLLNTAAWRMSTARYNIDDDRDTPDTELFLKLHSSGVLGSFEQTFDDFKFSAHMVSLRHLDPPQCS